MGDEILILLDNPTTLDDHGQDPYTIIQVHANGIVTLQRTMHITERINIRHDIKPFHRLKFSLKCGRVSDPVYRYRCI